MSYPTFTQTHLPDSTSLLDQVLAYRQLNWSVIPIPVGAKKAKVKWKAYQERHVDDITLRKWFSLPSNVAIVTGMVSRIAVRDFDDANTYEAWRSAHPHLAATCPTVETARGAHVYFRIEESLKTKKLVAGELRGDGGYVMVPPSAHPSGKLYKWLIPVSPTNTIPLLHLDDLQFDPPLEQSHAASPHFTEEKQRQDRGQQIAIESKESCKLTEEELTMIQDSLPNRTGQREDKLFQLSRRLLTIRPDLMDKDWLLRIFNEWWRNAQSNVGTKDRESSLLTFLRACDRVKVPLTDPLRIALERARHTPPPPWTDGMADKFAMLACLCRELQGMHGGNPFFLSCRSASKLVGVTHTTASKWLQILVHLNKLELVVAGKPGGNVASRYRYVG